MVTVTLLQISEQKRHPWVLMFASAIKWPLDRADLCLLLYF